jgi:hypothetical protein
MKVYLTLCGEYGNVTKLLLDDEKDNLERNRIDTFNFDDKDDVGNIKCIQLYSDTLNKDNWLLAGISIKNMETNTSWNFKINQWLRINKKIYEYCLNP